MGCLEWQQVGLKEPTEVTVATEAYRSEMEVLGEFLQECCFASSTAETLARDIYQAYFGWCERSGEKARSQKWLGSRLSERGLQRKSASRGLSKWIGIGLIVNTVN